MNKKKDAFRAAFPHTLPILAGFLFLGFSYGFLMSSSGFAIFIPIVMSIFVFAGSMQFVAVNLLLSAFNPLYAFLMTLMVNARHVFYGISMLDTFQNLGIKRLYLIFGMCDETFSVNYTAQPSPTVDRGWFMFFVTLLNHSYWVIGTALGAIAGNVLKFNAAGIDFALSALFVVIFMNQWQSTRHHEPAIIGVGASLLCLLLFGAKQFIVPAMILIVLIFVFARNRIEKKEVVR